MPSKPCARPGCDAIITDKPYKLEIRRYCSHACRAKHQTRKGFNKERIIFTDAELLAELRRRADWNTGSLTMCNVLAAAADRLEALMGAQKGRAA